jgi:hypothetical protein
MLGEIVGGGYKLLDSKESSLQRAGRYFVIIQNSRLMNDNMRPAN